MYNKLKEKLRREEVIYSILITRKDLTSFYTKDLLQVKRLECDLLNIYVTTNQRSFCITTKLKS